MSKIKKITRPDADTYFLKMTKVASQRSTCRRHNVGAIIVKDKQVLATGYNGAAAGVKDCLELGCLRDELGIESGTQQQICRAIHAEQNAIIQAAKHGADTEGSTLYCTHSPCIICAKMIVNAGIKRVVCITKYPDETSEKLFEEAGVILEQHEDVDLEYSQHRD